MKTETARVFCCLRRTRFGPVALVWALHREQPKVLRVLLSRPDQPAGGAVRGLYPEASAARPGCPEIDGLADRIAAFLAGEPVRLSLEIARMELCSPFQQRVLRAEHAIPRGRVSTYRRIAAHLGNPNAARAVGTALATNPFPVIVPCHRAIRSDGSLGGYQGGTRMKRTLLEAEGISFDASGRVRKEKTRIHY